MFRTNQHDALMMGFNEDHIEVKCLYQRTGGSLRQKDITELTSILYAGMILSIFDELWVYCAPVSAG